MQSSRSALISLTAIAGLAMFPAGIASAQNQHANPHAFVAGPEGKGGSGGTVTVAPPAGGGGSSTTVEAGGGHIPQGNGILDGHSGTGKGHCINAGQGGHAYDDPECGDGSASSPLPAAGAPVKGAGAADLSRGLADAQETAARASDAPVSCSGEDFTRLLRQMEAVDVDAISSASAGRLGVLEGCTDINPPNSAALKAIGGNDVLSRMVTRGGFRGADVVGAVMGGSNPTVYVFKR